MSLATLRDALAAASPQARRAILFDAAQQAIARGDATFMHLLCGWRGALEAGGAPALDALLAAHGLIPAQQAAIRPLDGAQRWPGALIWGHPDGVRGLAVGPTLLLSSGADGLVRAWRPDGLCLGEQEAAAGAPLLVCEGVGFIGQGETLLRWATPGAPAQRALLASPITALCDAGAAGIIIACEDGSLHRMAGDDAPVRLPYSASIRQIAVRADQLIALLHDGALAVLVLDNGPVHHIPAPPTDDYAYSKHAELFPDGRLLIEHIRDDPGGIYGPQSTWELLDPVTMQREAARPSHERPATPLPRLPSGDEVRIEANGLLWLCAPQTPHTAPALRRDAPLCAADAQTLWLSAAGTLTTFDARTGAQRGHDRGYQANVQSIIAAQGGCATISGYQASYAAPPRIWVRDADAAERRDLVGEQTYAAWMSAAPSSPLCLSRGGEALHARQLVDGQTRWTAQVPAQHSQSVGWSADGAAIALITRHSGISRVELPSGQRAWSAVQFLESARFALASDGARLLVDDNIHGLRWLDARTGEAAGAAGEAIYTGLSSMSVGAQHTLLGTVAGEMMALGARSIKPERGSWVRHITQRGALALVLGDDGRAELWEQGPRRVQVLSGHTQGVRAGVWLDDTRCATLDGAGDARLWERGQDAPLRVIPTDGAHALAALPDGTLLWGGERGDVTAWRAGAELWRRDAGCGLITALQADERGESMLVVGREQAAVYALDGWATRWRGRASHDAQLAGTGDALVMRERVARLDVLSMQDGSTRWGLVWGQLDVGAWQAWPTAGGEAVIVCAARALWCVGREGGERWRVEGEWRGASVDGAGEAVWAWRAGGAVCRVAQGSGEVREVYQHAGEVAVAACAGSGRAMSVGRDGVAAVYEASGDLVGVWAHTRPLVSGALCGDRLIVADEAGEATRLMLGR